MKEKRKTPPIVKIAIFTTFTTFVWIGYEVYHTLTTKPDPIVPPAVTAPIDPSLDIQTLESLKAKVYFSEEELSQIVSQIQVEPQVTEELPVASQEGVIEESTVSSETVNEV